MRSLWERTYLWQIWPSSVSRLTYGSNRRLPFTGTCHRPLKKNKYNYPSQILWQAWQAVRPTSILQKQASPGYSSTHANLRKQSRRDKLEGIEQKWCSRRANGWVECRWKPVSRRLHQNDPVERLVLKDLNGCLASERQYIHRSQAQ